LYPALNPSKKSAYPAHWLSRLKRLWLRPQNTDAYKGGSVLGNVKIVETATPKLQSRLE